MILGIKTDSPTCELALIENGQTQRHSWEAGRGLAKGLLAFIEDKLAETKKDWDDVHGIIVFQGPGSFTGLRIGITVANAIAYASDIPIVASESENWLTTGAERLEKGENDSLVMPKYGAEPHITQARK